MPTGRPSALDVLISLSGFFGLVDPTHPLAEKRHLLSGTETRPLLINANDRVLS
jgi:hypothetical protein